MIEGWTMSDSKINEMQGIPLFQKMENLLQYWFPR